MCAITSLTAAQARPAGLARIMRGHWGIEDRLHRLPARHITRRDQVPDHLPGQYPPLRAAATVRWRSAEKAQNSAFCPSRAHPERMAAA